MTPELHPSLPLAVGAVAALAVGPRAGRIVALLAAAATLALVLALPPGAGASLHVLGHEWIYLRADGLARVFAIAFALFGAMGMIYAWSETSRGSRAAMLALCGAGVGVALAGDLLTFFFFWEWLSAASLFIIWGGGTRAGRGAGTRYFLFHILGGMCLLGGIVLLASQGHSLRFDRLALQGPAAWLIVLGMAANAAIPPLHAWLPDAYPEASPAGTVLLSAFTTKGAVYALARAFPGEEPLMWAGAIMALYGVVFAVLENDIRRLLGYHIISQVGYMVCGVGLGSALAVSGASAHAFSHIFYKGLLMMSAGAVIAATGRRKLTELGGLGRVMPLVLAFYAVGAFSISGVPLFNGFVSKSLVISASAAQGQGAVELMLVVASMGTFLSTGLKLPFFTFFSRAPVDPAPRPVPPAMMLAMAMAAAVCIVTGVVPSLLYRLLPHAVDYRPYTADHVLTALQLLVGTGLGFWILRSKLDGEPTITLDADRVYRFALPRLVAAAQQVVASAGRTAERAPMWIVLSLVPQVRPPFENMVARARLLSFEVGLMVVALIALGLVLLF